MVVSTANWMKKNLAMAWIDYKKAFVSVPHSWISVSLNMYRAHVTITRFVEYSMRDWKTELMQIIGRVDKISIKRGIFQWLSLAHSLLFSFNTLCLTLGCLRWHNFQFKKKKRKRKRKSFRLEEIRSTHLPNYILVFFYYLPCKHSVILKFIVGEY